MSNIRPVGRINSHCSDQSYNLISVNNTRYLPIYLFTLFIYLICMYFQSQLDFDFLHPGKANKFYLQWNEFISKIKDLKKTNTKEAAALVEYIDG